MNAGRRDRWRLRLALAGSALLHLLLVVFLWREPVRPQPTDRRAQGEPVTVELFEAAPEPSLPPPAPPLAPPKPKHRRATAAPPATTPEHGGAQELTRGAETEGDGTPAAGSGSAGGRPSLQLTIPGLSGRSPRAAAPGRTLSPDDPSFSPETRRAEEVARVGGRVTGWLDDTLAAARAENGVASPYVYEVGTRLLDTLSRADGGTPAQLGVHDAYAQSKRNLAQAMGAFARTGNPGLPPPGHAPLQSETLRQMGTNGNADAPLTLKALVQAKETQAALEHAAPLLSLELELQLAPSGKLEEARIIRASDNSAFNQWVLEHVPRSLEGLGPAPAGASRRASGTVRTVWRIDGWLRSGPGVADTLSAYGLPLDTLGTVGVPVDALDRALGIQSLRFDYRVRLVRAY